MGATTECALALFWSIFACGRLHPLTSQSVSLSLSRDPGITKRELTADLWEFTADLQEFTADLREFTADLRKFTADLREFTADLWELTADLPGFTADLPEFTADLLEFTAGLCWFWPYLLAFGIKTQTKTDKKMASKSAQSLLPPPAAARCVLPLRHLRRRSHRRRSLSSHGWLRVRLHVFFLLLSLWLWRGGGSSGSLAQAPTGDRAIRQ